MWDLLSDWIASWVSQLSALVWLVVAFVAFIVEVSVPHFGFAFVGTGALAAAALAFFGVAVWLQLLTFAVVLVGSLVLLRSRLLARLAGRGVPSRTEQLVGKQGMVTHDIDATTGTGRVNVAGQDWAAHCSEALAAGTRVRVVGADGIVLEVSRT